VGQQAVNVVVPADFTDPRRVGLRASRPGYFLWCGYRSPAGPRAAEGNPAWPAGQVPGYRAHVEEIMTAAGPARVVFDQPGGGAPSFLVVLTHGAGGTPDTADVLAVRDAARELGAATALVTQPYRVKGARAPGSAPKQDAAWAEVVEVLRGETARDGARLPLVQCGRSNGARVACRTARQLGAAGVIALAFPLHPPGQPGKSRDAELRGAGTSVLVVNGDRDPFGVPEPDEMTSVVILPGETHALSRRPAAVGVAVVNWLSVLLPPGGATPRIPRLRA
jgi:predicted alpha/beta-hydrolase family hydrolase